MGKQSRAVMKKIDHFPWYEWVEEFEWENDEWDEVRSRHDNKYQWQRDLYGDEVMLEGE